MNCPKCSKDSMSRMISRIEAIEHLVCHECLSTFMLIRKGGGDGALMVEITDCIEYLEKNVWQPLGELFDDFTKDIEEEGNRLTCK